MSANAKRAVCLLFMENSTHRDLGENVPKAFFVLLYVPLSPWYGEDELENQLIPGVVSFQHIPEAVAYMGGGE